MRTLARLIGVAATLWGLLLVVEPSVAPRPLPGVNYLAVLYAGLLALGLTAVTGTRRLRTRSERATLDGGDDPQELAVPGANLDRAVREEDADGVRERLREVVVDALVSEGTPRADAEHRVTCGSWTDDAVAASFLGSEAGRPPWRHRLLVVVRPGSALEHRTRRTVAALERRREGDGRE